MPVFECAALCTLYIFIFLFCSLTEVGAPVFPIMEPATDV